MPSPTVSATSATPEGAVPLRVDAASGRAFLGKDNRVALFSADFVREVHFAIVEAHADTAQDVLYRSGFEWALRSMVTLTAGRPRPDAGSGEAAAAQSTALLTAWWAGFQRAGWGVLRILPKTGGTISCVELHGGVIADALGPADDPVCHLYAGLIAGAFSFADRAERHGVEISCRAARHDSCRFLIGPVSEVDRVEAWRQQGVPPHEIIQRITGTAAPAAHSAPADSESVTATGLHDGNGRLRLAGSADMLRSLQFVLERERAGSWTSVFKATGRACGRRLAVEQDADLARSGRPPLSGQPLDAALQPLETYFRDHGWGVLATDASGAEEFGLVIGALTGSAFAELLDDSACFADPLAAGMLQGYFEHVTGQVLACDEIACSRGAAGPCTFALSTPDRLAVIAPFVGRESGAEIIARLRT